MVAAGFLVAAGREWSSAQQPTSQAPIFRSTVDIVRVEATVLDKDRRPVRGLTADDFTVLENGQERPVVAFAPVELPQVPSAATSIAAWVREAPRDVVSNDGPDAGRLIVIAFDWSIRFYDQQLARRIALAAVDRLGPTDQATVIFTRPNGAAGRPQNFTADRALLRAAIREPIAPALTDPHPDRSGRLIDPEGYSSGDCFCGLCTLESLTQLGRMLRSVSQRPKVVLFIGTYVRSFEGMRPTVPVVIPGEITPSFSSMPGTNTCSPRLRDARRDFERAMGESNVTVHVIDPVGLETGVNSPLGPDRMRERLDSLPIMADMTGGRTVTNAAAPEDQVAAILEESSAYYVLGFTPASSTKRDATRRIEVRARKSGFTVKARNQYSLAEQPVAASRPEEAMKRAVSDVLPARGTPLEMSAVPFIAGARTAALLVGRFGGDAARPTAMLSAALTQRAAPVTTRRVAIPPAADRGKGLAAAGLVSVLLLEPGAYELRVATESSAGGTGSVHTFVEIPDFRRAPLAMSGVLLHVSPEEPVALDEVGSGLPFVPTARRKFAPGDAISAFVQVTQGTARKDALQPTQLRLRINDARDAIVRNQSGTLSPAEFGKNRTANARLSVPLRELPPGEYLLTLEATSGEHRAERLLRFEVVR